MMKEDVPVYQTHDYLEDLLKKEGEPTRNTFSHGGFRITEDGKTIPKWIAVKKWADGKAEREEFDNEVDCLVWLTDADFEGPFVTEEEADEALERLWDAFTDVPVDPETEYIEEPFLHFPAGTPKEEIWRWFDREYTEGVHALLYGGDDPEQRKKKYEKIGKMVMDFYAEKEEDLTAYVCYCIVDCDDCCPHADSIAVIRNLIDVGEWWLKREADLEEQGMWGEEDSINWSEVTGKLRDGADEVCKAVYERFNGEIDPMNCVTICVKKVELK